MVKNDNGDGGVLARKNVQCEGSRGSNQNSQSREFPFLRDRKISTHAARAHEDTDSRHKSTKDVTKMSDVYQSDLHYCYTSLFLLERTLIFPTIFGSSLHKFGTFVKHHQTRVVAFVDCSAPADKRSLVILQERE